MSNNLSILGASGHGKIVLSAAVKSGFNVTAFYDDNITSRGDVLHSIPIKDKIKYFKPNLGELAFIGIGDNQVRFSIASDLGDIRWAIIIHPASYVDPSVKVGAASLICAGVAMQIDTTVGIHSILNTNASVDHDCLIGDFVHIAPGVNISGNVTVGDGTMIGVGASIIPNISIGKNCIVGAGSVVINNVPDNSIVVGCPAKVIKSKVSVRG